MKAGVLATARRWLASLRARVVFAVCVVTVAPVVFVVCSPYYERVLEAYLEARTDRALAAAATRGIFPAAKSRVALVRVTRAGTSELFGSTSDRRAVTQRALSHQGLGRRCTVERGGRLHLCASWLTAPDGTLLYVEASDERSVRSLGDDRVALVKLTLLVLPGSLLLALWLSRRIVRPLENLQKLVHQRADSARPKADLPCERDDEIGDVSQSFNRLIERLVARQQANETFLQDLAHELKSPVAAVRACADRLDSEEPLDPERKARLARVLRDSGQKFERVITDFLELASAEAGLPGEQRVELDVHELVDNLVGRMRVRHERLSWDVRAQGPLRSCVVASRFETAISELLENAAHFAATRVSIELEARGTELCLSVTDDGPGIAAEHVPQVFDRFFTRRAGVGGTGLGLSIVHAVLVAHEGDVTVRSEPGQGARFELTLPRLPRAPRASAPVAKASV